MVRLGFHTLHFSPMFGGPGRLAEVVDAAGQSGFTDIGVDLASVEAYCAEGGRLRDLPGRLTDAGLRCSDVLPLTAGPAGGAPAQVRALVDLVTLLGAPRVVASVPTATDWNDVRRQFDDAAAVVAGAGARLAIEYIPHSGLRTLDDAQALCAHVGWDRAALVLDSFHSHLGGTPNERIAGVPADRIALVQYSDARTTNPADPSEESRNHRVLPGEGCLRLGEWREVVTATGWQGTVTAEVLSRTVRAAEPAEVAARCHAALVRDWG